MVWISHLPYICDVQGTMMFGNLYDKSPRATIRLDLVIGSVDFSSTVTKSWIWSSQKRDDTIIIFAIVSDAAVWSFVSSYLLGLEQIVTTKGLRKNRIEFHDLLQHDRIHIFSYWKAYRCINIQHQFYKKYIL